MYASPNAPICIYICVCIYIEIYIIHPISYQYIVLLPPQNPGTSRLKFVVPVKMAYVGLYQLLPRTNSKSLYMNASPRPMLQSISSHTGIWPRKSQQNFTTSCSTAKNTPTGKTRFRYKIYKQRSILQTKVKTILYHISLMLGMILQNAIQLLRWVECSSNIDHFYETSVPSCGTWISQQDPSEATHASWKGYG